MSNAISDISLNESAPKKARRPVVKAEEAQDRILKAVDELFYLEGARSVSVDAVVKRADLNKMTVYRQFEGKESLLTFFLQRREKLFWGYIDKAVAKADLPGAQLLQIFKDLVVRVVRSGYRGCPFVNIAVEFPDRHSFARVFVEQNKEAVFQRFLGLATAANAAQPKRLATSLSIMLEGVYAASQTYSEEHEVFDCLIDSVTLLLQAEKVVLA